MRVTMTGVVETGEIVRAAGVPRFPGADLALAKGGSLTVELTVLRSDGTPVDLSTGAVVLTVKQHSDAIAVPTGFTRTGIVDPRARYLAVFTFEPEDTVELAVRRYVYDVWWEKDSGREQLVPLRAFLVAAASGRPTP